MNRVINGIIIVLLSILAVRLLYNSPSKYPELLDKQYVEPDFTEEKPNPYVIRLHDHTGQFFCSGFIISNEYALTAGHCLIDETFIGYEVKQKKITIKDIDGNETGVQAMAAGVNGRLDWGIIRGDFSQFEKAPLLTESPPRLREIPYVGCGFPMGKKTMFCSYVFAKSFNAFFIIGPGAFFPGMSGGPVVDQLTGNVVGIISHAGPGYVGFAPLIGILASFGIE